MYDAAYVMTLQESVSLAPHTTVWLQPDGINS